MKHFAKACLLAALSAVSVLAESVASPASTITNTPQLDIRQNGLVDPNAGVAPATSAPAVTQYEVGGVAVLYTQTFAAVPDQWPSPQPGTIGLGTDRRRDVAAQPTMVEEARVIHTEYMMQSVVLQMVTEVVTVPVRRATNLLVVQTVTVGASNATTGMGSNGTTVASVGFGTGSYRPTSFGTGLYPSTGFGIGGMGSYVPFTFATRGTAASAGVESYRPLVTGTMR